MVSRDLLKKWVFGIIVFGFILAQSTIITYAENGRHHEIKRDHHHHFINEGDLNRLLDQGYSKDEILRAAHIAKYSNKKVDDVLNVYKKNDSSWEKTAEHYGLDLKKLKEQYQEHKEKYLQEHKNEVIENVAEYSGKTEDEINSWVDKGISLRFIVVGAAIAKVSNKDLSELIKLKQEGLSFKDMKDSLNIDKEKVRAEKKALMKKIKEDIKD
ncbi:hypothetical protein RRV45_06965 [Bacillus sp. DTU_2020_1000418_1_SI_GHA_SEK_038]|uniref:hypothetical protein n=1 Tax=Bacillus sp. DTU_2020_1000418_1_SI_GHA_SEK_038 TaxID=3077585 RepID=UPI0028E1C9D4|nr:hypothetical protein [Bacillus sp. DTU_2020_1000418_1_SI_GHA_SEK_038]WNS76722.1 hypothetical protein RRV45_06965 [Bacillus sp. DTU_2020_1000418_1_SI_GHA_SEK_038]